MSEHDNPGELRNIEDFYLLDDEIFEATLKTADPRLLMEALIGVDESLDDLFKSFLDEESAEEMDDVMHELEGVSDDDILQAQRYLVATANSILAARKPPALDDVIGLLDEIDPEDFDCQSLVNFMELCFRLAKNEGFECLESLAPLVDDKYLALAFQLLGEKMEPETMKRMLQTRREVAINNLDKRLKLIEDMALSMRTDRSSRNLKRLGLMYL